jgi:hypothetical protein
MATPNIPTGSVSSQSVTSSAAAEKEAVVIPADENVPSWIQDTNKEESRSQPWRNVFVIEERPDFHKKEEIVDFGQCGVVASGSGTLAA